MKTIINRWTVLLMAGMLVFFQDNLHAQDIEVKFSILDESPAPGDSLLPYLKIEYINKSSRNYYLPSLFSLNNTYPRWFSLYASVYYGPSGWEGVSYYSFERCRKSLYDIKEYKGKHYNLPLRFNDFKWEQAPQLIPEGHVLNDGDVDIINFDLFSYTDYVFDIYHYNKTKSVILNESDLNNTKIMIDHPLFVFIKANERVTQLVSLSGINGTGITLTIGLSSYSPSTSIKLFGRDGRIYAHSLPDKVYDYTLYKGEVKSAAITKEF